MDAIRLLEDAGKHLVQAHAIPKSKLTSVTALAASEDSDPDIQALAVISICLTRAAKVRDNGWVREACRNLGIR